MPDGVEETNEDAFRGCSLEGTLTLPHALSLYGSGCFASMPDMVAFQISQDNTVFCCVDGVLFSKDGKKLIQYPAGKPEVRYEVPQAVTEIGESSFVECTLEEVLFPQRLLTVGAFAFDKCVQLQNLLLPGTLTEINEEAFAKCAFAEITIPDSVTKIGEYAFSDNNKLEKNHLGSGLAELSAGIFLHCPELRNVLIPAGIGTINKVAFRECEKLECVLILNPDCEIYADPDTFNGAETVICGFAGSSAETWAEANGNPFCAFLEFEDVAEYAYYYLPVLWASARGITAGTSDTSFGPDVGATRAQVVAFLWRFAGSPEPELSENPFADVADDAYYAKAVLWAKEKGITSGVSDAEFAPDKTCSRAEFVTFLWRLADSPEPELSENPFEDVPDGAYYYNPVLWAYGRRVTAGTGEGNFSPAKLGARCEIVTFLWSYLMKKQAAESQVI